MFCIKCHHPDTKVTNSRPHKKQASIWRRRRCQECDTTFTTLETVASEGLLWVSKEGSQESFQLPRLMISLYESLKGPKNAPEDAYWLAQTVFEQIMSTNPSAYVEASRVAETAYEVLCRYDETAGLRYGLAHQLLNTKTGRVRLVRRRYTSN